MSRPFKTIIKNVISIAGISTVSILLNLPAVAIVKQPLNNPYNQSEYNGKTPLLLAQGSSGDAGDEGLNNDQLPRIDVTNDESSPTNSNNTQQSPRVPSMDGNEMTEPSSRSDNGRGEGQYSSNSDRLKPGTWLCVNNPNPGCNS